MSVTRPDHDARCPRPRADLASVVLDDEMVVYDSTTRTLHHLNPTATLVWQRCDGVRTVDAIAASIAQTLARDGAGGPAGGPDEIHADVAALVDELSAAALLVHEPAE
jgi:hypothetical protein